MWSVIQAIPGIVYLVKKFDEWVVTPLKQFFRAKEVRDRDARYEGNETRHGELTEVIEVEARKPVTEESDEILRDAHRDRYNQETK